MLKTIMTCCRLYNLSLGEARLAVDKAFDDGLIDKTERQACQETLRDIELSPFAN